MNIQLLCFLSIFATSFFVLAIAFGVAEKLARMLLVAAVIGLMASVPALLAVAVFRLVQ